MKFKFQERDGELLETIDHYDGFVARRHLKERYWPTGKTPRAMEKRLSKLYHSGYVDFPKREEYRLRPIPEPIVWLGWRGALYIAGRHGAFVDPPTVSNETQLRTLQKKLKELGIRWMREPRYIQLAHDLVTIDTRMAIEKSVEEIPGLVLEEWVPEGVFLSDMDQVEYEIQTRRGGQKRIRRGVRPDGYFVILDLERERAGLPPRARYLLELDNATHPNPRFGNEKVSSFVAYIKSRRFKERFGDNVCEVLVVTKSSQRMKNLMQQTKKSAGDDGGLFLFSTMKDLGVHPLQIKATIRAKQPGVSLQPVTRVSNAMTDPVWSRIGSAEKVSLFAKYSLVESTTIG